MAEHAEAGAVARRGLEVLPLVAAFAAAFAGVGIWIGLYQAVGALWLAAALIGVAVGLAVRFTATRSDTRLSAAAAALTAAACAVGYVCVHMFVIKWLDPNGQPTIPGVGMAIRALLNDLLVLVLVAIASYLAFMISQRAGGRATQS